MTPAKQDSPPWQDILGNILRLEESRGFDDHAVVGGLDKFVQRWAAEMAGHLANPALIEQLTVASYAGMSPEERRRWTSRWRAALAESQREAPAATGKGPTTEKLAQNDARRPSGPSTGPTLSRLATSGRSSGRAGAFVRGELVEPLSEIVS